jgi:hypothetical protein
VTRRPRHDRFGRNRREHSARGRWIVDRRRRGLPYLITPDIRGSIKQDLELLNLLPAAQAERRAELQRAIELRIDDLIAAVDRYRPVQKVASYRGVLRDLGQFALVVLFTVVWWGVDHHKSSWLPMFIVLIVVLVWTAGFAFRGVRKSLARFLRRND